jgi:hypothetical protein
MSTIPFIGKFLIDGVEIFVGGNSGQLKHGNPQRITNSLVNGSQVKTIITVDQTTARSSVQFSIRANANSDKTNPSILYNSLRPRNDIEITFIPESGNGGYIFRNMTLINDLEQSVGSDASIMFMFEGATAITL